MAVNETIITGRMYRVWDKANSIWKRFSYWTKASDVEMNDGTTVENTVSQLKTNLTSTKTTTFPSDGSILDTYSSTLTKRTVFNSDGSISEILTDNEIVTEHKTVFNVDGSISVIDVPQGGE